MEWPSLLCAVQTTLGGLGVIDLKLAGFALRTRWLWLQKTDGSRAWSELQIQVEPEVHALFQASTVVRVGNGEKTLFWTDNWIEGKSVSQIAPNLFNVISSRIRKTRTVATAMTDKRWTRTSEVDCLCRYSSNILNYGNKCLM